MTNILKRYLWQKVVKEILKEEERDGSFTYFSDLTHWRGLQLRTWSYVYMYLDNLWTKRDGLWASGFHLQILVSEFVGYLFMLTFRTSFHWVSPFSPLAIIIGCYNYNFRCLYHSCVYPMHTQTPSKYFLPPSQNIYLTFFTYFKIRKKIG